MAKRGRIYWPGCAVCQYIKRNPALKQQILDSTYFDPLGSESLIQVFSRWGQPFGAPTIYSHMRRHVAKTKEIELSAPVEAVPIESTEPEVISSSAHERALDEIIAKGRNMVASGQIKISAQALNTAIKTKSEIEKANKDRHLDAIKMFAGAFKKDGTSQPRPTTDS